MRREINIANVIKIVQTIKKQNTFSSSQRGFLFVVESSLEEFDARLQKLFQKRHLKKQLININQAPLAVDEINQEYTLLANEIRGVGESILNEFKDVLSADNEQVMKIAKDLLLVAKLIPKYNLKNESSIYEFCIALGGVALHMNQNNLPTTGAYTENDIILENEGICSGLVIVWAEQSIKQGTPFYPITSSSAVLIAQEDQRKLSDKLFITESIIPALECDLKSKLDNLSLNIPYQLSLCSDKVELGHALGIRKQANQFEIFDPNYGYFFFHDSQAATHFLNTLIREYQNTDIPDTTLIFKRHKGFGKTIEENKFPGNAKLDKAAIKTHTSEGHSKLIQVYRQHIDAIVKSDNKFNKLEVLLQAIADLNQHLSDTESQSLINELKNAFMGNASNEENKKLILGKDAYLFLAVLKVLNIDARNLFINFIEELTTELETRKKIPEEIQAITEKVDSLSIKIDENIISLADNLAKSFKENKNTEEIRVLQIKLGYVKACKKSLKKFNIKARLRSTNENVLHDNYTCADANKDLETISLSFLENNTDEIKNQARLLAKLDLLKNALWQLESELFPGNAISSNLTTAIRNIENKQKNEIINALLIKIDNIKNALLNREEYQPMLRELMQQVPQFDNLPVEGKMISSNPITEALAESLFVNAKTNMSKKELDVLYQIYDYVSNGPHSIQQKFQHILNSLESKNHVEINILHDLIFKANKLKQQIINIVTPGSGINIDVTYLVQTVRQISPFSIDDSGASTGKPHDYKHVVDRMALPEKLNTLLTTFDVNNPETCEEIKKIIHSHAAIYQFLQENRITLEDYFNQICRVFNLDENIKPYEITLNLLQERLIEFSSARSSPISSPEKPKSENKRKSWPPQSSTARSIFQDKTDKPRAARGNDDFFVDYSRNEKTKARK